MRISQELLRFLPIARRSAQWPHESTNGMDRVRECLVRLSPRASRRTTGATLYAAPHEPYVGIFLAMRTCQDRQRHWRTAVRRAESPTRERICQMRPRVLPPASGFLAHPSTTVPGQHRMHRAPPKATQPTKTGQQVFESTRRHWACPARRHAGMLRRSRSALSPQAILPCSSWARAAMVRVSMSDGAVCGTRSLPRVWIRLWPALQATNKQFITMRYGWV
ncbi:hypothetical protein C8Q73DRAFT_471184 [Cubamyces lactineus]|nr:hypothetical protein C8Q73DRAFT_471184 [Cubamyces lactineus]